MATYTLSLWATLILMDRILLQGCIYATAKQKGKKIPTKTEMHLQKNIHFLPLTFGTMPHETLVNVLYILYAMYLQSSNLLRPTVLQENPLFDCRPLP